MASVQDIETRIIGIENMLKFVLTLFSSQDTSTPFAKPVTLLEAYYRALAAGVQQQATQAAQVAATEPVVQSVQE